MPEASPRPLPAVTTARLRLRPWRPADAAPFAAINADPAVAEFLPRPLTRAESDALIDRFREHAGRHGFAPWAVTLRSPQIEAGNPDPDDGELIGVVGLITVAFSTAFTPAVEILWRLARRCWGQGYASEAAAAALDFGFSRLALDRVVAFTAADNHRSRAVMARLGLRRQPDWDFDHPRLPAGDRLSRHLVYRRDRGDQPPVSRKVP